jgi:flavin reductase (NADH)
MNPMGAGDMNTQVLPLAGRAAEPDGFRRVMGLFPAAVSVVTALDADGVPRGLTCSAVCSLSMDPPSMLICVNRRNRSLEAIRHSAGFVVNLLRAGCERTSEEFASASPHKFVGRVWRPSPTRGLPLLVGDALAFVECALSAEVEAGSHLVAVGLVQATGAEEPGTGPLVYWRRAYGCWADAGQLAIDMAAG